MAVKSLKGEKWKYIKDTDGKYQISNLARVKNVVSNKILKGRKRGNVLSVNLQENNMLVEHSVRSLVFNYFINSNIILTRYNYNRIGFHNNNSSDISASNMYYITDNEIFLNMCIETYAFLAEYYEEKNEMITNDKLTNNSKYWTYIFVHLGGLRNLAKMWDFKLKDNIKASSEERTYDKLVEHINNNYNGVIPDYIKMSKDKGLYHWFKKFGGIHKVASENGFLLTFGYKTLDNNIFYSTYEANFANFLYDNNIKYETQKKIVDDLLYRYDFKILNIDGNYVYIEIWGLYFKEYTDKREIKTKLYNDNNLILISIEGDLFKNGNEIIYLKFKKLMIDYNIKISNFNDNYDIIDDYVSYNEIELFREMKEFSILYNIAEMPTAETWRANGFTSHMSYIKSRKITMKESAKRLNLTYTRKLNQDPLTGQIIKKNNVILYKEKLLKE